MAIVSDPIVHMCPRIWLYEDNRVFMQLDRRRLSAISLSCPLAARAAFSGKRNDKIRHRHGEAASDRTAESWPPRAIPRRSQRFPPMCCGASTKRADRRQGPRQADMAATDDKAVAPKRAVHGRGGITERITMEQDRQEHATPGSGRLQRNRAGQRRESSIERESAVRSYCRVWPKVFDRAAGSWLYDEDGRAYLDFFTGASALNYGHNNPALKQALLDYLASDRVIHSLDMHTVAKAEFLTAFDELILQPRQLDYRVQFPGPGGTNAVEAALKLARKVTGRTEVITFTGAFHGMTLGALAVTSNRFHRDGAGVPLRHAIPVPFGCRLDGDDPGAPGIDRLLHDSDVATGPGGCSDRGDCAGRRRDQRGPARVAVRTG